MSGEVDASAKQFTRPVSLDKNLLQWDSFKDLPVPYTKRSMSWQRAALVVYSN